jgi:hypothetical protein
MELGEGLQVVSEVVGGVIEIKAGGFLPHGSGRLMGNNRHCSSGQNRDQS